MRRLAVALLLFALACHETPTAPRAIMIASGRWTGDGACLMVAGTNQMPQTSRMTVGCGQGRFPVPVLRSDGTFDVDGTYGIVAGPVGPDPLPPAHYSGTLSGSTLTLTVTPSVSSIPPATYKLHADGGTSCPTPCV